MWSTVYCERERKFQTGTNIEQTATMPIDVELLSATETDKCV